VIGSLVRWHAMRTPRQRHAIGFALGLISAAAFAPLGLWPLMLPCLVWLVWSIDASPSLSQAFWAGWWTSFGQLLAGLYWIMLAWQFQASMPVVFAIPIVAGLCAFLALYGGLAALCARKLWHGRAARLLILAATWMLGEGLRGIVLTGFPWNELGTIWVTHALPMAQSAAVFGQLGLSGLTILIAGACAILPTQRRAALAILGSSAAITVLGGVWLQLHPTKLRSDTQVHVVQANIGQDLKWTLDAPRQLFSRYLALSQQAVEKHGPGIVIWPETAVPSLLFDDGAGGIVVESLLDQATARYRISRRVLANGGLLITGIDRFDFDAAGQPVSARNALAVFNPEGDIIASYEKAHLVPLGEYLPLRSLMEPLGLSRLVPGAIDFLPGPGARTLDLGTAPPVGPMICYEMIFAGDVVARKRRPAWLLNISNDGWFGISSGPHQHLAQGRMRAIEYGLPMVRSTSTGISAVIDSHGRLMATIGLNQAGVLTAALPEASAQTPYGAGRQLIPIALAMFLLLIGWRWKQP
jgi:apolipoprotein N-acyltransferase